MNSCLSVQARIIIDMRVAFMPDMRYSPTKIAMKWVAHHFWRLIGSFLGTTLALRVRIPVKSSYEASFHTGIQSYMLSKMFVVVLLTVFPIISLSWPQPPHQEKGKRWATPSPSNSPARQSLGCIKQYTARINSSKTYLIYWYSVISIPTARRSSHNIRRFPMIRPNWCRRCSIRVPNQTQTSPWI